MKNWPEHWNIKILSLLDILNLKLVISKDYPYRAHFDAAKRAIHISGFLPEDRIIHEIGHVIAASKSDLEYDNYRLDYPHAIERAGCRKTDKVEIDACKIELWILHRLNYSINQLWFIAHDMNTIGYENDDKTEKESLYKLKRMIKAGESLCKKRCSVLYQILVSN